MKVTDLPIAEALGNNPFLELLGWIIVALLIFAIAGGVVIIGLRSINRKDKE